MQDRHQSFIFSKHTIAWIGIIVCFLAELIILATSNKHYNQAATSILFFIASLLIGILPLIYRDHLKNKKSNNAGSKKWLLLSILASVVILVIYFFKLQLIIRHYQINYLYSDIIPTLMQQTKRFMDHEFVYKPIVFAGYSYPSGYLPAIWIPFLPAAWFTFDYRYIPFCVFSIGVGSILFFYRKKIDGIGSFLAIVTIPLSLELFISNISSVSGFTVEVLIGCYYMFLLLSVSTKNFWLIGISIGLCLLSRYTVALWLPLFFIVLIIKNEKKLLMKTIMVVIIFISLFYIIPFFLKDPSLILTGLLNYSNAGPGEWERLNGQTHLPEHLTQGVGFAYFFYLIKGMDVPAKIRLMQLCLISILFVFLIAMSFIFYRFKNRINTRLFLICSLKIYLALFYTFIHIPYIYLYTVPLMVSAVLVFHLATAEKEDMVVVEDNA